MTLLAVLDRFLDAVSKRRPARPPSTLHLLESAHGRILAYHAGLLRVFDGGMRELSSLVRGHPAQYSLDHAAAAGHVVEGVRQAFLGLAGSHYPRAFDIGRAYLAHRLGQEALTPGQAQARIRRQEQDNANYVDRSLLADVRDEVARALALVTHVPVIGKAIAKQDGTEAQDEEQRQAEEQRRREDAQRRQDEALLVLLLLLLDAGSAPARATIEEQIVALLGVGSAAQDAAILRVIADLPEAQAALVRQVYAQTILEEFADAQVTRIGLYARRLWALVNDGFSAEANAAGYMVDWVTTSGDPCHDCLELESDGPYRPGDLPTVPGGGDTVCLSNCLCRLDLVPEDGQTAEERLREGA